MKSFCPLFMAGWLLGGAIAFAQPPRFQPVDAALYRGAAPETPEEFAFLKQIGIKTIISVDRAKPNLAVAESLGIRYVQIPIGYAKVPRDAALDFLKAMRMSSVAKPVYLHCHAGKFRAGAMAATYRVAVDKWSNDSAFAEFLRLGGSDKYKGLNHSILAFARPTDQEIEKHVFDPDKAPEPAPLAERMSDIDRLFDEVKKLSGDSLEMGGNAQALEEHFAEIERTRACKPCDSAAYVDMKAMSLRFQLMRKTKSFPKEQVDAADQACNRCHERIRN